MSYKTDAEILINYAKAVIAAKEAREIFANMFSENCSKQSLLEANPDFEFALSATGREAAFQASIVQWHSHKKANQELGKAKRALLVRGKLLLKLEQQYDKSLILNKKI